MTRVLWAFTRLRWRLLVNRLKGGERRDAIERISRAAALVVPGLVAAAAVSAVVMLAALGAIGGWFAALHPGQSENVLTLARVVLLLATIFAALMPVFIGAQGGAARATRLLLLPVSPRTLHFVEVCSTLADPWMAAVAPGLIGISCGLFAAAVFGPGTGAAHAVVAGLISLAGAFGMILVLASLAALASSLVSWLVRDRRRGELFVLVFVLLLAGASMAPALLSQQWQNGRAPAARTGPFVWAGADRPIWARALPSELYGDVVVGAASWVPRPTWLPLIALCLEGAVLFAASGAVHRRLAEGNDGGPARRKPSMHGVGATMRVPGLWPGTSAVAVAQVRTGLRSVRGRLAILLPGPVIALLVLVFRRLPAAGPVAAMLPLHGYLVWGAAIVFGFYATQAFTMNQFGSDRAGLTLEFLAPIRDVDLVRGKAAGCAAILAAGALLSLLCVLIVAPGGSPWQWVATIMGGAAAYLVLSPLCASLSIVVPVAADLSRTGTAGNPHNLAMLAGLVAVALAVAPAGLILATCPPSVAVLAMGLWLAVTAAAAVPLLGVAARLLSWRRENLALVAQGR